MKPTPPAPDDFSDLRSTLLAYYDREARDLPWRRDRDPYRILVSEIMLQQTRVETVLRYYDDWLERFPTVEALADAHEDEVMKAWEGLGYYRRARNLHQAAKAVRERPGGFPERPDDLRALPGVGEYTAGAVASIVFDEVTPAVDGNVRRVLSRLHDEPDPRPAWLRDRAAELVDPVRPGDWNQAVMELGATVCTPRSPRCEACPVTEWCAAEAAGTVEQRPAAQKTKEVPRGRFVLAVAEHGGRVLVGRRPPGGLLAGLWAFPEKRLQGAVDTVLVAREVVLGLGLRVVGTPLELSPVHHRFSHLDATYIPVVVPVDSAPATDGDDGSIRWICPDDPETALPVAQRKVLEAWDDTRSGDGSRCTEVV